MLTLRRLAFSALLPLIWILAGCVAVPTAPDAATLALLAPAGSLRVGVYPGSPTSMVAVGKSGDKAGVAQKRFYTGLVRKADNRFAAHLKRLKES